MRLKDTGLTAAELKAQVKKYMIETYERMDFVADYAEGIYMYDENGEAYLDFYAGIAVNCLGNCNPKVVKAVQEQSALIMQTFNYPYTIPQAVLSKEICETIGMDKVMYQNSGAEANEAMIKIARKWGIENIGPDAWHIITAKQSFHGRTFGAMTATGQPESAIQKGFGDLTPGFTYAEFNNLDAFKAAYVEGKTCAIMFEPVQGEGGYVVPPVEWLKYVRELCDKHGIMLIFDEVQTGFGRTGNLYAWQTLGVEPDIFTSAKAIAGGLPLSAVFGKKEIMDKWAKGAHGGTYGGNPVSCAASLAVLEELYEGGVLENVKKMGEVVRGKFYDLQKKYDVIGDVRGLGLMNAIEFVKPEDNAPDGALCAAVQAEALKRDLLLLNCGADHNNIRLIPPLNVDEATLDTVFQIIDESIAAALKG